MTRKLHPTKPDFVQPSVHRTTVHLRPAMSAEPSMQKLDELPPEMIEFTLLKATGGLAPRLGRLSLAGRKTIETPAFVGNTSRGVIPHVSQDNFRKSVGLNGVYVPLEDCMYFVLTSSGPLHNIEPSS
jgi:hypothetical protein